MIDFVKAHKGKITAVVGATLIAVGSYMTGAVDLMGAVTSVVSAVVGG